MFLYASLGSLKYNFNLINLIRAGALTLSFNVFLIGYADAFVVDFGNCGGAYTCFSLHVRLRCIVIIFTS